MSCYGRAAVNGHGRRGRWHGRSGAVTVRDGHDGALMNGHDGHGDHQCACDGLVTAEVHDGHWIHSNGGGLPA